MRENHGLSKCKLYRVHSSMVQRCINEKRKDYKYYGGRGIKVCNEWLSFLNFYDWSMKNGYKEGLQIDRIDRNCNYEPSNCKWVTQLENTAVGKLGMMSNNKSGFIGVHYSNYFKKWVVQIQVNKKRIRIGMYETQKEAVIARINKEIELFGEQRTNFHFEKDGEADE